MSLPAPPPEERNRDLRSATEAVRDATQDDLRDGKEGRSSANATDVRDLLAERDAAYRHEQWAITAMQKAEAKRDRYEKALHDVRPLLDLLRDVPHIGDEGTSFYPAKEALAILAASAQEVSAEERHYFHEAQRRAASAQEDGKE